MGRKMRNRTDRLQYVLTAYKSKIENLEVENHQLISEISRVLLGNARAAKTAKQALKALHRLERICNGDGG